MNLIISKSTLLAGLCTIVLSGYSSQLYAGEGTSPLPTVQQAKKVTGTVSDAMGPVIGASVVIKGTSNGVATDFDGNPHTMVQCSYPQPYPQVKKKSCARHSTSIFPSLL